MAQDSTDQHLTIDDPCLEGTEDCRDPYGEALHLLAAVADGLPKSCVSKKGDLEEKGDSLVTSCSGMKDKPRSPHIMATAAATPSRQSEVRTDGKVVARARAASITSTLNDAARPQVAEVDSKQEWEIRDIIGKEDVDGVVHYLVEWSTTLVPKYELGKAKGLVEKFEARLRAQARQGNKRQRPPQSMACLRTAVAAHGIGRTQQKKRRSRPRK
jgi:hypothetical protein